MNPLSRLVVATTFVLTFLLPAGVEGAVDYLKPDLKILSIGSSPKGPGYARVVVANVGYAASGACSVRVSALIPNPGLLFYHVVPALPAATVWVYPTVNIDVKLNGASPQTPGQQIQGFVDCFGEVVEKNEFNNGYTFVHP